MSTRRNSRSFNNAEEHLLSERRRNVHCKCTSLLAEVSHDEAPLLAGNHVVFFNCLNCHRREEDIVWESGCKLFIGCMWTQKSDWWRRSTGFLFLDSQTYRMYAQFALVEHYGKKVLLFVKKSATLSQAQIFLSADNGKQFHVAPCSSSQNS